MRRSTSTTVLITLNLFVNICLVNDVWLLEGVVAQSRNAAAVNIGVVLDMDSLVGKIGMSCIDMAISDFYAAHPHYKTRVVLNTRDSMDEIVAAAAAALDLIKNVGVQAIIGPRSSMQANFVISLGNKSQVPIVSVSATSPSLTSFQSPYFFRAAQSDSSQVKAISAIVEAFGWREAVLIYVDNQFGEIIIPFLTAALQEINTRVSYLSAVPESATDDRISKELYKLKSKQTRVFILHAAVSLGSRILVKAEEIGMMSEGYVWIMTESMTSFWRSIESSAVSSFQGALGVKSYAHESERLENFTVRWKRKFQGDNPNVTNAELNIFGLWTYDAIFALAMAVEKVGTANLGFDKPNISGVLTDLETLGVSRNGPRLVRELSNISFRGLSGDFHFVNGQFASSVFQIVNINGNGERRVGFWTPEAGLIKNLSWQNTSVNSTSRPKLGPIIWPGEVANSVPKGWELPTEGKRLKIGVPVKDDFTEFVKVIWDNNSNSSRAKSVQGFCIDVFDHAMAKTPYHGHYDYIPFATPDRKSAGSYNDLVDQVYYGNYDAVVGDVTIIANRSLFVEFTLPYTESGVSMLVPIRDNKKNAWVFLQPLTPVLWVTSVCLFVLIGFVVWVLEHKINEEFQGPPAHQVGTSFWFSFSTMVFADQRVVNNLARFVVIVWCFVVLILTQSYTASLTSLLTVEQLQPTVTDINELLKRKESVGFQDGSFIEGILLKLKFDKPQLKAYTSPEELNELLVKGSAHGGISAAFIEIPYSNLFLAKYCGKYTTVKPTFKTDGFGFVFPKGSPFVSNVSSAVLNVTQGDEMEQIQNKWFKSDDSCPSGVPTVSSTRLGLDSFWGLFLLAGIASTVALIIFAAMFLYEQRHVIAEKS